MTGTDHQNPWCCHAFKVPSRISSTQRVLSHRAPQRWTKVLAKEGSVSGEAVGQFNIHAAKTNLSRLIERVEHGEEIIICRAGQPVAKIIPLGRQAREASFGSLKGKIVLDGDGDSPQTNEALALDFGISE